jgi:hypothetical protein
MWLAHRSMRRLSNHRTPGKTGSLSNCVQVRFAVFPALKAGMRASAERKREERFKHSFATQAPESQRITIDAEDLTFSRFVTMMVTIEG